MTYGGTRRTSRQGAEDSECGTKKLRRSCDRCTSKKVRCDGLAQCTSCLKRGYSCHYSKKRKTGPRLKTALDENPLLATALAGQQAEEDDKLIPWLGGDVRASRLASSNAGSLASKGVATVVTNSSDGMCLVTPTCPLRLFMASPFGPISLPHPPLAQLMKREEAAYLEAFLRDYNAFVPVTKEPMVREAVRHILSGQAREHSRPFTHDTQEAAACSLDLDQDASANMAVLWGGIAIGCLMLGNSNATASTYASLAWLSIKDCSDRVSLVSASAHLIMAVLFCFLHDSDRVKRYLGTAELLLKELDPKQHDEELNAVLWFLKAGDMRLTGMTDSTYDWLMSQEPPLAPSIRGLYLVTRALAMVSPVSAEEWRSGAYGSMPSNLNLQALLELVDMAEASVVSASGAMNGQAVMSIVGGKCMLLLMMGHRPTEVAELMKPLMSVMERVPGLARLEDRLHYTHVYGMVLKRLGDLDSYRKLRQSWRRAAHENDPPTEIEEGLQDPVCDHYICSIGKSLMLAKRPHGTQLQPSVGCYSQQPGPLLLERLPSFDSLMPISPLPYTAADASTSPSPPEAPVISSASPSPLLVDPGVCGMDECDMPEAAILAELGSDLFEEVLEGGQGVM